MRLRDVVLSAKSEIDYGQSWKPGPMPKNLFPLTKSGNRTLRFGSGYQWRLVTFTALSTSFRLLIAVSATKEQYYAHLGMVIAGDTRMLGSLEFHGSHPGWHLHAGCDDVLLIPPGRYEGPWRKMLPTSHSKCRRKQFNVTDANRLTIAIDFFRVKGSDPSGQTTWI
jgi:hypothetical protein